MRDDDALRLAEIEVPPVSEADRRAAGLVACRAAQNVDEARMFLAALGLTERRGCPICGGPLSILSLSRKSGLRGTCSSACAREQRKRAGDSA